MLFFFCQASERRGNMQTKVRVSCDKCTVLFFLWSEYNQTVFVPFRKRRQALPKKKKISEKSWKEKYSLNSHLCVYYSFSFLFLIRQTELLPGSVGTVCLCMRENAAFYCSPLMFKLFSLRVFAVVPVSCTSFLGLYCPGACTPGTERGCWYTACVCVCEREGREREIHREAS